MERIKSNLFIVGAAKGGTTSMHFYLSQHPGIFMARVKEPNFFSDAKSKFKISYERPKKNRTYITRYVKNEDDYLSLFEDSGKYKYRGEASTSYLYDETTAQRIFEFNKDAKIIIMLREPVNRAFSQYVMDYNLGLEDEYDFLRAIEKDELNPDKIWGGAHLYIGASLYYEQIKRYKELFPPEQLCILKFEDFISSPVDGVKKVLDFLGLNFNEINSLDVEPLNKAVPIRSNRVRKILLMARASKLLLFMRRYLIGDKFKDLLISLLNSKEDGKSKPVPKLGQEAKDFLNDTYFNKEKEMIKKEYNISW